MTQEHKDKISQSNKGRTVSAETRHKISEANKRRVIYHCDYCGKENEAKPSAFNKYKKHFCNKECYTKFQETVPMEERPNYKGIRKPGETKSIYHRRYCNNNPERIAHLKANRYALNKGAEGSHTLEEWINLKLQYNNKCAFCSKSNSLTKDHIIPLSEGGTNYISNIQRRNCNSKKWKHLNFIYEHPNLLNNANNT